MIPPRIKRIARWIYGRLASRREIAAYLSTTSNPRLNLGCGHNVLPGWLNVDLEGGRHGTVFMDASRDWPLPDNSFQAILCEHTIEHLPKETGKRILFEALIL
jgi:predicted SAM-dependent methyltransferase